MFVIKYDAKSISLIYCQKNSKKDFGLTLSRDTPMDCSKCNGCEKEVPL